MTKHDISEDNMDDGYRRGRTVESALHAHIVFVAKYRRGLFSDRALADLRQSFIDVCHDFGVMLRECDGEDDHIHLLVEFPPSVQLSKLVNSLKGVSSRRLRAKKFPEIEKKLRGGHLWSPSYFIASCGGAPLEIVRDYVASQRGKQEVKKEGKPLSRT